MKRRWIIGGGGIAGLVILVFCMPVYVRQALIHWYPEITDTYIFPSHTLSRADSCWEWPMARNYNRHVLTEEEQAALKEYGTVAYVVIQRDSILYEEYRDDWTAETLSNLFSATKSIVGLLAGIAIDEGAIGNIDDPVGKYLPEFKEGDRITVRNLLTMSSGLDWDESYSTLFSQTTQAYYGDHVRELVMGLKVVEEPGKRYAYKSGDTQLLAFVVEAATGKTLSRYAEEKLWRPMRICRDALWNLDRADGDEKAYCCFNTTARDLACFGRLILNQGNWEGRQLISAAYLGEAVNPASYLENEFGDGPLDYYGYQIWIMKYRDMKFPAFRGLGGQYLFIIPQKEAIVVRLGHKRSDEYVRENTVDMNRYLDIAFRMLH